VTNILNFDVVRNADVHTQPYRYIVGDGFLKEDKIEQLRQDFPTIDKPGFLTVQEVDLRGTFKQLIDELESSEMADALSSKLGLDLDSHPRLTTIRRLSQLKDGRIHTDSESKLATFLVYMNDAWNDDGAGRLRVLNGPDDFDAMTAEISPVMGSCFGFRRADNSWHGHKPFAGERRVVQITWLRDASELERKKKRNSMAQFFKGIFGR
jgi:SM-20-related protein